MSLSSLVGRRTSFSDRCLRISLRTVQLYAEGDADLHGTTFPAQVSRQNLVDLLFPVKNVSQTKGLPIGPFTS